MFKFISITRYVLLLLLAFKGHVAAKLHSTLLTTENHKLAGNHAMGPCRQAVSGQKELLFSLPTDVLSLSFIALLLIFLLTISPDVSQLTVCLEETRVEAKNL